MMGYDKLWFESQPVSDEFKCPICTDVIQDSQTVGQCEHVFCLACIQQCFETSKNNQTNCPVCCEPINSTDLKPTIWIFRNLLDKLRVRCQFESCAEVVELQHMEQHRLNCDQNPENEPKPCPKQCGAIIPHFEKEHDCVKYLKDQMISFTNEINKLLIQCQFESCNELTKWEHFEQHRQNCKQNPVNQPKPCPKKCGAIIPHLETEHDCDKYLKNLVLSLSKDANKLRIENEQLRTRPLFSFNDFIIIPKTQVFNGPKTSLFDFGLNKTMTLSEQSQKLTSATVSSSSLFAMPLSTSTSVSSSSLFALTTSVSPSFTFRPPSSTPTSKLTSVSSTSTSVSSALFAPPSSKQTSTSVSSSSPLALPLSTSTSLSSSSLFALTTSVSPSFTFGPPSSTPTSKLTSVSSTSMPLSSTLFAPSISNLGPFCSK